MSVETERRKSRMRAEPPGGVRLAGRTPDIVIRFDRDFRALFVAGTTEVALGFTPEHLIGLSTRDIGMPEHVSVIWERAAGKVFESGEPTRFTFEHFDPSGLLRHFETSLVADEVCDGRVETVLSFTRDRTEEHGAEVALAESERRFRGAFDDAAIGMNLADPDGILIRVNSAFATMLGGEPDEFVGLHTLDVTARADREQFAEDLLAIKSGARRTFEKRYLHKDGSSVWARLNVSTVRDDNGAILYFIGEIEDIRRLKQAETEQRRAQAAWVKSEERYTELVERARDAIYTSDLDGRFTSVNQAAVDITGYSRAELCERTLFDLIVPGERAAVHETMRHRAPDGSSARQELQLVRKDGSAAYIEVMGRLVEANGRPDHLEGIAREVGDRRELEDSLREQALHDALTGLPNRVLFHDRLAQALGRSSRGKTDVAVMMLDVDDFKLINDTLGHGAGDQFLLELASRLQHLLRESETVARLGGDEFGFVAENLTSRDSLAALVHRIESAFAEPFEIGDSTRTVDASIGIAVAGSDATPTTLLRDADLAMYRAKGSGSGFEFFNRAIRAELLHQLELTDALRRALALHELDVQYQPIVNLEDGKLLAVEALVRWRDPGFGWVEPHEFIPLAEQTGLIVPLGRTVLAQAVAQLARWRRDDPQALPGGVYINVSARELSEHGFVDHVREQLVLLGMSGADIALELTERVFIDNQEPVLAENLAELARLGVRLILDDFGTGYSALASLKRFPLAAVKIDRDFIEAIQQPGDEAPIVRAVVVLGHALGMAVIAEGVESELQLDYLREIACDAAQGFHLGHPAPAAELSLGSASLRM